MLRFSRCARWAFALPLLVLGGCSRQGPGELCDRANGSNDCDDGLACVSKDQLRGNAWPTSVDVNVGLCCPAGAGPESIVPGCTYGSTVTIQDSGAAPPTNAASDGAGGGASSDAPAAPPDAAPEAGADAAVTTSPEAGADAATLDGAALDGAALDGAADVSADSPPAADGSAPDAAADAAE
jgi:hypothetical protein